MQGFMQVFAWCAPARSFFCATAQDRTLALAPKRPPCQGLLGNSCHQGGREFVNALGRLTSRLPPLESSPCTVELDKIARTPSREWRIQGVCF